MSELLLLDELVPRVGGEGDWEDVLHRARRRRRGPALVVALLVVALTPASALAVVLTRAAQATLPPGADRSNVVVVLQPLTGRIVVQAAPWKKHDGICFVLLGARAGCVPRSARNTAVLSPPLVGYTFDRRVVSGTAVTASGKHVRLLVHRFGGRVDATFFVTRDRLPRLIRMVILRDDNGRAVVRLALKHP
jgi:hypothetical protein